MYIHIYIHIFNYNYIGIYTCSKYIDIDIKKILFYNIKFNLMCQFSYFHNY